MARRRFEFVEGSSSKFWEVSADGASFTVTFGRMGTDGQSKTKKCKDASAAKAEVDKLVAEKVKKGYSPVSGKKQVVTKKSATTQKSAATKKSTAKPKASAAKATKSSKPSAAKPEDRYRPAADALVADLQNAAGDEKKEDRALEKAIKSYIALAGPGAEDLQAPEYFAEDGSVENPPALERVKGASEDAIFRWREKLADLCGYNSSK